MDEKKSESGAKNNSFDPTSRLPHFHVFSPLSKKPKNHKSLNPVIRRSPMNSLSTISPTFTFFKTKNKEFQDHTNFPHFYFLTIFSSQPNNKN